MLRGYLTQPKSIEESEIHTTQTNQSLLLLFQITKIFLLSFKEKESELNYNFKIFSESNSTKPPFLVCPTSVIKLPHFAHRL